MSARELPFKGKSHACLHVPSAWVGRPNAWSHSSIMWARTEREARTYCGEDRFNVGAVRAYLGKFTDPDAADQAARRLLARNRAIKKGDES